MATFGRVSDEPVTEEALEAAEALPSDHFHDGIAPDDASLAEHLREMHDLEPEGSLSASTLNGLHDRLHEEAHAVDE